MLWLFRSKSAVPLSRNLQCLEKTAFWVQSEQNGKDSIYGCRANKRVEKTEFWGRSNKIPGKTALLGAERTKSLEKQHFWVQSELTPWKKQRFCLQSEQNPWKTALSGAEQTSLG